MRVAIVGSRKFPQLQLVDWFVRDLPAGVTVVTGGAKGVDLAAEECARRRGLDVVVHLPDLAGCKQRHEFTKAYYARNQKIVDDADLVVAFTEKDAGGTWDTIKRARKAGKPVKIIRPCLFFPPAEDGDAPEDPPPSPVEEAPQGKPKGAGPFQLRGVSLGSYALRRKSYISSEEWADILTWKDADPHRLADYMRAKPSGPGNPRPRAQLRLYGMMQSTV